MGLSSKEMGAAAESEPIVTGQWHLGFEKCKKYAEENDIPMFMLYSRDICSACTAFEISILDKTFVDWKDQNDAGQVVYCFVSYGEAGTPDQWSDSDALKWVSLNGKIEDLPIVAFYWQTHGIDQHMMGKDITQGESGEYGARKIIESFEKYFGDYVVSDGERQRNYKFGYDETLPIKRIKPRQQVFASDEFYMDLDECLEYAKTNEVPIMAIYIDEDYQGVVKGIDYFKQCMCELLSCTQFVQFCSQHSPFIRCMVDSKDQSDKASNQNGEWQYWINDFENDKKGKESTKYRSPTIRTSYFLDEKENFKSIYRVKSSTDDDKEKFAQSTLYPDLSKMDEKCKIRDYFDGVNYLREKYPDYVANRIEWHNSKTTPDILDNPFKECGRYSSDLEGVQEYSYKRGTIYRFISTDGRGECGICGLRDKAIYSKDTYQLFSKEADIPTVVSRWTDDDYYSGKHKSAELDNEIYGLQGHGILEWYFFNEKTGDDTKQVFLCRSYTYDGWYLDQDFEMLQYIGKASPDTLNLMHQTIGDMYGEYTGNMVIMLSWIQQRIIQKPKTEYTKYTYTSEKYKGKTFTSRRRNKANLVREFQIDKGGVTPFVHGLWDGNEKSYFKMTLSKKIFKGSSYQRTEVKYQWRVVTGIENNKEYLLTMQNFESDFDEVYFCVFFDRTKAESCDMDSEKIISNADIKTRLYVGMDPYPFNVGENAKDGKIYICFTRRDVGYMKSCSILFNYTLQESNGLYHKVTFLDSDGKVLNTVTVEDGKDASYEVPKAPDGYVFIGWNPDCTNVTSDLTCTAQYKREQTEQSGKTTTAKERRYIDIGKFGPSTTEYRYDDNDTHKVTISYNVTRELIASKKQNGIKGQMQSVNQFGAMVDAISADCFYGCTELTDVNLLSSKVRKLGTESFAGCSKLGSVYLPDTVQYLGNRVFDGCGSLSQFVSLGTETQFGKLVFQNCPNLSSISLGHETSLEYLDEKFLQNSNVTEIRLLNMTSSDFERMIG